MIKTFFRKCLTGALFGTLMLTALPMSVWAEEKEPVTYDIKVAGVLVNTENAEDVLGDGTVSYDSVTNTLTLDNVDMDVPNGNYCIRAEGSLNIELKGTNKIESEDFYGVAVVADSDGSTPDVKIGGDGSLEASGLISGILVRGNLTIGDSVKVYSECRDVTSDDIYGIRVNKDLIVCDNAELTVKSAVTQDYSYGVYVGNSMFLSDNAKVTTEAGNGIARSCGTYVINSINITDNAQLNTKGIDNSASGDYASESYGIRTTNMYVSGGGIDATGQGASGISAGIYTQNMELSGGTVTVNSINAKSGQSIGIQSITTLYVSGGTLIATSGDTTADSWAIDASGELKVTGGTIIAKTGTGDRTYGIYTDTAIISGGTVEVNAQNAESQSRGIQAMNGLTISGGYVEVASGDASGQSYAIQTSTTLDITGGNIIASSGTARKSSAIYSGNNINIKDATVEVTSQGMGINAPYGGIDIGCTEVKPSEDASGLVGTKVVINAIEEELSAETEIVIDEKLVKNSSKDGEVIIEPLGYEVYINDPSISMKVMVPAGKSVYDVYPDFDSMINTTREGYEFNGFYTDEACSEGNEYNFTTIVDADITIYVKWVENVVTPEEEPDEKVKPEEKSDNSGAVNTGDSAPIMVWMAVAVLSMGTVLFARRKYTV